MVGNGSLNKTEGGREEGRKGRVKFVQGKCGWRRGPEQDGVTEGGRNERGGENLFRIDMVVDGGLNITG